MRATGFRSVLTRKKSHKRLERKDSSLGKKQIPEEKEYDLVVALLLNRTWQLRRMVVSRQRISFAYEDEEEEIDYIPLAEVEFITTMRDLGDSNMVPTVDDARTSIDDSNAINTMQIATTSEGHNSGRAYYIQPTSKKFFDPLMNFLIKTVKSEKKRAEARTGFQRSQYRVRRIYESLPFQASVALMIGANFVSTIVESQIVDSLSNGDGSKTDTAKQLEDLDLAFTLAFAAELVINAYSHWFKPFAFNPWNILDTAIVITSLVATLFNSGGNGGVVRVLRALRVIRLFGRVKSLRKIISALTLAALPVLNVFLILSLMLSIFAVISVSIFGKDDPANFGVFDNALMTLFRVTAGQFLSCPDLPSPSPRSLFISCWLSPPPSLSSGGSPTS